MQLALAACFLAGALARPWLEQALGNLNFFLGQALGFSADGAACAAELFKPKYDLVLSLEVAEHMPPEHIDKLAESLAAATSKYLVFTAARPGQGGTGHVPGSMHSKEWWREAPFASVQGARGRAPGEASEVALRWVPSAASGEARALGAAWAEVLQVVDVIAADGMAEEAWADAPREGPPLESACLSSTRARAAPSGAPTRRSGNTRPSAASRRRVSAEMLFYLFVCKLSWCTLD